MRLVVTGASGHLGACLTPRLVAKGFKVRAVCYGPAPILDALDVEQCQGDVRDIESLRKAFEGQEALIHMAAHISIHDGDEPKMRAVNVDGARNAAQAALDCGVRRMVHVSSVHAYETWKLGRPLREDGAPANDASPPYDRTKAAGEREIRAAIARGLDAAIVNPVGILGPHDHIPSHAGNELLRMHRPGPAASASGGFPWVDVRDVADAIIAAMDRGETGKNYLLGGEYHELAELFRLARKARGQESRPSKIPIGLLLAIAPLAEAFGRIARVRHGVTRSALRALASDLVVDSSRAAETLGFRARPLEETVRDAIQWWRENGYL